ncbi:MAG: hypothetical protein LKE41_00635 [Prevotella sp.]|jgi:hypothetical protein|nr:hypothetical protein [Prevotella sp.]MCI2102431.1 hypothetical protein [Prevotella sp.]
MKGLHAGMEGTEALIILDKKLYLFIECSNGQNKEDPHKNGQVSNLQLPDGSIYSGEVINKLFGSVEIRL